MTLAEAIRLGCMLKPKQAFNAYYYWDVATCVIGAVMEAIGLHYPADGCFDRHRAVVFESFPILSTIESCSTGLCDGSDELFKIVIHLNDKHRWTRERIADWVESLEQPAPQTEPERETVLA